MTTRDERIVGYLTAIKLKVVALQEDTSFKLRAYLSSIEDNVNSALQEFDNPTSDGVLGGDNFVDGSEKKDEEERRLDAPNWEHEPNT